MSNPLPQPKNDRQHHHQPSYRPPPSYKRTHNLPQEESKTAQKPAKMTKTQIKEIHLLMNFFTQIITKEREIEFRRQMLSRCTNFEPYSMFKSL